MVASSSPEDLSRSVRCWNTSAPLPRPLSTTETMRLVPITVPATGSGLCTVSDCSPCTRRTQSMPESGFFIQKPG